jgi:hypothetical protein
MAVIGPHSKDATTAPLQSQDFDAAVEAARAQKVSAPGDANSGLQNAHPRVRPVLLEVQGRHSEDRLFMEALAKLVRNSAFAELNADQQEAAIRAFDNVASREIYRSREGFFGAGSTQVSGRPQQQILDNLTKLVMARGITAIPENVRLGVFARHATDSIFCEALVKLVSGADFASLPQDEQLDAIRNLDRFASSEIYRGIGGRRVSDDDKRVFLEALRLDPSITAASLSGPRDVTAGELLLQAYAHLSVRGNPAADKAFESLIRNRAFERLPSDARIAVLSAALQYPDVRSIENLQLLAGRDWFLQASPEDRTRSVMLIAYVSQYSTGDAAIINNTLRFVLTDPNLTVKWKDIATGGTQHDRTITLSWHLPLDWHAVDTLAHEVNHVLNNDKVEESYRYFMAEYRAWYVGHVAAHGRPPSQQDCFNHAQLLVTGDRGLYAEVHDAFRRRGSDESKQIVDFIARITGANRTLATPGNVLQPGPLSTTVAGFAPEPPQGVSYNLDNHH